MPRTASAVVKRHIGLERALVQLDSGDTATIQQEAVAPGVPLEWLFPVGSRLDGQFDSSDHTFVPNLTIGTTDGLVKHFGLDSVTLGLVTEVERQIAKISVLPNLSFDVTKSEITGNPLDVISSYLGVGDVVPVRIYRDPQGRIRLRMDNIDDDEPVFESVSVLPGGEPWLQEGRDIPWVVEEAEPLSPEGVAQAEPLALAPAINTPIPGPGMRPAVAPAGASAGGSRDFGNDKFAAKYTAEQNQALRAQVERLQDERLESDLEVIRLQTERDGHREEIAELRREAAEARKAMRAMQTNRSTTFSRRSRFASNEDWFREELRRAWIGRYLPDDRVTKFPLDMGSFGFAPEFFESVTSEKLDESEVRKVVRIAVDVVTGRNAVEHMHTVHMLYEGQGGAPRKREDGAICWRVHLENGSPQAKRLHYWALPSGRVELGWVANHDDDL